MSDDVLKEAQELYDAIMGESNPDRSNTLCYILVALTPKIIAEARKWRDNAIEERARGNYFDESQDCEGYSWDRKDKRDYTQNHHRERAAYELGVNLDNHSPRL